jgi:hypothetical protein
MTLSRRRWVVWRWLVSAEGLDAAVVAGGCDPA